MAIYEQKSRAYLSPHTWRRHKNIYRRRRLRLFSTQDLKLYLGVPLHARHIKLTFKHIIMLITDWQVCWLPSLVCDEMDRISTFLNTMEVMLCLGLSVWQKYIIGSNKLSCLFLVLLLRFGKLYTKLRLTCCDGFCGMSETGLPLTHRETRLVSSSLILEIKTWRPSIGDAGGVLFLGP